MWARRAAVVVVSALAGSAGVSCASPPPEPSVGDISVSIQASPAYGFAPLRTLLTAEVTDEADSAAVILEWEFDDGSPAEVSDSVLHDFLSAGRYTVSVRATTSDGRTASADTEVVVDPPRDLGSIAPIDVDAVGDPIAVQGGGDWEMWGLREPGAAIYDPATAMWIATYTGRGHVVAGNSAVTASVGAVLSTDAENWFPHPQNPLTGADQGEDPYLAKDAATGLLWRDSHGRALMFTEEKDFDVHRGVEIWRSDPNALTGWELVGRAVDRGAPGSWDATDRTSPTVIHDGGRLVLLFEGRNLLAGQEGEVGLAVSTDEGESWEVSPEPVLGRGNHGAWNANSVVPDDLLRLNGRWVLLAHGQLGSRWSVGRYETEAEPATWTIGTLTELPGNPMTSDADTVMAWGDDPLQALRVSPDGSRLERLVVRPRP